MITRSAITRTAATLVAVLLTGVVAFAAPEPASVGVTTLDASGGHVGDRLVRITQIAGDYPQLPVQLVSPWQGLVWTSVMPGTYELVVLDAAGTPVPETLAVRTFAAGSHDNIVALTVAVSCPGDLDGSGFIDVDDLVALLVAWGPCHAGGCAADIDDDSVVGVNDLVMLIGNWGGCD